MSGIAAFGEVVSENLFLLDFGFFLAAELLGGLERFYCWVWDWGDGWEGGQRRWRRCTGEVSLLIFSWVADLEVLELDLGARTGTWNGLL